MALVSTKILEELVEIYSERYVTQKGYKELSPEKTIRVVDEALLGQNFQYDPTNRQHRAVRAQMYAFATDYGARIAEYNADHSERYGINMGVGGCLGLVITGIATSTKDPDKGFMAVLLGAIIGAAIPAVYTYFNIRNRFTEATNTLMKLYSERLDRISSGTYSEEWEIIPTEVEAIVVQGRRGIIDVKETPGALARRGQTSPIKKN